MTTPPLTSFGAPALALPFHLRGYDGAAHVYYTANDAPDAWGFDLLNLPFALDLARGYPVCQAEIEYGGAGYRALMGWIQLITNRDPATEATETSMDLAPIFQGVDSPFVEFGPAPTFFDAPANPDHESEDWIADTFLAICPDIARTPRIVALLGFRWGYQLRHRQPTPLPVEPLAAATWDAHLPLLRREYPRWTFESGFDG